MASKVHRVRFYNPKPRPINCVSFNKTNNLTALARDDASIEIWDLKRAPYMVRFIPGVENASVEALGWCGDRLLSTGITGSLIEWDITKLQQKKIVLLTGYAAWCLDVNNSDTLVAVGTEQGYINLYSVDNDDIVYNKLFDKQDGRIMCCKFSKSGNVLVTGSIDTIRVWNVETGHAMNRISVSRRQKEVIVWCVTLLSDNTIVSGDSYGRLTFWDSTVGEQIESYTTHKADILSIAVSDDEKSIYCSGIDPIISHFIKVDTAKGEQTNSHWVKHVQRHIHEHDVRALLMNGNKLVSAGIDGYLTFSSYPPKWVMRIPPMMPAPRSFVCPAKKLLLLSYSNHLEVWKLGSYATSDVGDVMLSEVNIVNNSEEKQTNQIEQDSTLTQIKKFAKKSVNQSLKLTENPLKLTSIKAKHKKQIQCCAFSPSGEFIVYSTDSDLRMLKLDTGDQDDEDQTNISLSKILITGLPNTCDRVAFTEDSRTMLAYCDGTLYVLHVDPEAGATVTQTITGNKVLKTTSIIHLIVSKKTRSGGTYVILADSKGVIEVLVDRKKKFVHHITLPKYHCVPAAMTVDDKKETLIIVYADQTILEYDLENKKVSEWPGQSLPQQWLERTTAVQSVSIHPRKNALVCQDETSLWILKRSTQNEDIEPIAKKRNSHSKHLGFNVIPIKYMAGFHWIDDDEAVILEVLPENIVSQLPAPTQVNRWT